MFDASWMRRSQIIPLLFLLCGGAGLIKSPTMMTLNPFLAVLRASYLGLVFGLLTGIFASVAAQTPPRVELNVVGGISTRPTYSEIEQPFWTKSLAERSDGAVTAKIKGFDEMGLKGQELLRLMREGVIEFGVVPLSYYAPDTPLFEALDIAGLALDAPFARSSVDALTPVLKHFFATQQVRLLGIAPYGAQYFFCNVPIRSHADLRGQSIRTITRTQAEFVEALGAKSVSMPFGEVLKALEDKTIGCAIGGAFTGYTAKWYTHSTHLYALPVGWNQEVHAVNQKAWDKLDTTTQTFLELNIEQLIQSLWDFSEKLTQRGVECLTGRKECLIMPRGSMTLVVPTASDMAAVRRIATQKVLPLWAERCSEACVADFNQTIGKLLKTTVVKSNLKK